MIEVGDYIRLKNGDIGKYFIRQFINYIDINDNLWGIDIENDIVKHSKNIIDLIEEHDLLKIEYEISNNKKQTEVVEVIKNYQGLLYVNTFVGKFFVVDLEHYDRKMLSIVTKEQFANIEYRLESS